MARAYVDQLERSKCLGADRIAAVRQGLASAERASGTQRREALTQAAAQLGDARGCDAGKVQKLQVAVKDLAAVMP